MEQQHEEEHLCTLVFLNLNLLFEFIVEILLKYYS